VRAVKFLLMLPHRLNTKIELGADTYVHFRARLSKDGLIKVGDGCFIDSGTWLMPHGGSIFIGDGVSINRNCVIYGHGIVKIGSNVHIANSCKIVASNHSIDRDPNGNMRFNRLINKGIEIGDNVWLGSNVIVLDGVVIGNNCVIGAGSVVTKSLNGDGIYVGNPARFLRKA